jgi:hypothetical protein
MFDCNNEITVWNKWRDPATKKDVFFRHVLPIKCKFAYTIERGFTGSGAGIAGSNTAVVPYTDGCLPAERWRELDEEGKRAFFTLQVGDILALGAHDIEITGERPYTSGEVKAALAPLCIVIKAVADNTLCAHGKHWRVEGL